MGSAQRVLSGDCSPLELVEVHASDWLGVRRHQVRPVHRTCAGEKSVSARGQLNEVTEASGCTRQIHTPGHNTGRVQDASGDLGRDTVRSSGRPHEVDRSEIESSQRYDVGCRVTVHHDLCGDAGRVIEQSSSPSI